MDLYPDNMVSQLKTKLNSSNSKDKWEVGLLEALFPRKVFNIFRDSLSFTGHRAASIPVTFA